MSNKVDPSEYGPRLHAYLERHWHKLGTNANAWVNQHPALQGPTVSRWRAGSVPTLHNMRAVADALGVSMLDVLIAAGVVDPREARRPASEPAAPPSVDDAIASDPSLTDRQRRWLREMLEAMREVESGRATRRSRRSHGT